MQEVWQAIRLGADAYLARQLKTILPLIFVLTAVLFFLSISFLLLKRRCIVLARIHLKPYV